MPDRDPATEGVLAGYADQMSAFKAGYAAALRSLGAGTPEAQAALRALVRIKVPHCRCDEGGLCSEHQDVLNRFDELAALATPTEEGR